MEFFIKLAEADDVKAIYELMSRTYAHMEQKELFYPDDLETIRAHVHTQGEILLAYEKADDKALEEDRGAAAFLMVRFPGSAADNLGIYAGLADAQNKVVHMESAAVDEHFRGRGLQQRLIACGEQLAARRGYTYSMCTVSPKNLWSLNNMLDRGYAIVATVPKYGGLMRHVLCKYIGEAKE